MIRSLVLAVAVLLCTPAHAAPVATVGVGLSWPEIAGVYLSVWPTSTVTIDARVTLATLDGGVTGHIPVVDGDAWGQSVLVQGMAGWAGLPYHLGYNSVRLAGLVGYGWLGVVDVRLEAGVAAQALPHGGWGAGPIALGMVGLPL